MIAECGGRPIGVDPADDRAIGPGAALQAGGVGDVAEREGARVAGALRAGEEAAWIGVGRGAPWGQPGSSCASVQGSRSVSSGGIGAVSVSFIVVRPVLPVG